MAVAPAVEPTSAPPRAAAVVAPPTPDVADAPSFDAIAEGVKRLVAAVREVQATAATAAAEARMAEEDGRDAEPPAKSQKVL